MYNIVRHTQKLTRDKQRKNGYVILKQILCSNTENSKNHNIFRTQGDARIMWYHKNGSLKTEAYTSELLNISPETLNSVVEDIIDLLQDKSNLSLLDRSAFAINLCLVSFF